MQSIDPWEQKRIDARKLCQERKLTIRPYGRAWWIVGNNVSLIVSDLAWINERDLEPVISIER